MTSTHDDLAQRLRAALDTLPVPERPWTGVKEQITRRRTRRRAAAAVTGAALAVTVIAVAIPAGIGALGHSPGPAGRHGPPATVYVAYERLIPRPLRPVVTIVPISTATNTAIRVGPGGDQIAITPNGKTAYVAGSDNVTPINTATNTAGQPIHVGIVAEELAVTPNGKTTYVANAEGRPVGTVVPISTATNTAGKPIHIGSSADQIAITPDGKTLYAAAQNRVVPISTATNTAGTPIHVRYGLPNGIVITP